MEVICLGILGSVVCESSHREQRVVKLIIEELNPMPPLNFGDWYELITDNCGPFMYKGFWPWEDTPLDIVSEIRFPDGRKPWRRS